MTNVNAKQAAEFIADSYQLFMQDFKSRDEHIAVCTTIRNLFGGKVYTEEIFPEIHKILAKQSTLKHIQ